MQGRIIKGIGGFYYIYSADSGLYECKAKGIFRNKKVKPLIGDFVTFDILDEEKKLGNLVDIAERSNELLRPAVANVDQAVIVFAVKDPDINFNLLDRFLLLMKQQGVNTVICFNKIDKVREEEITLFRETYKNSGCRVVFTSVTQRNSNDTGVLQLREILKGKTSVLAGPSGVGKSTIMNLLLPEAGMETGQISEKIKRGRHTTRHSELFCVERDTYLFDTPGFSSLYIDDMEADEVMDYIPEFKEYEEFCRFRGCVHMNEPGCMVKLAVNEGKIAERRYENYRLIYEELKNKKKY